MSTLKFIIQFLADKTLMDVISNVGDIKGSSFFSHPIKLNINTKSKIKYIRSLNEKKFRNEYNTFVAEGTKLVFDLLASCRCQLIIALPSILSAHPELKAEEVITVDEKELKKATFLKTAPQIKLTSD